MHQALTSAVKNAVIKLGFPETDFVVEYPADFTHGDYSTNVALALAKSTGSSPRDLAEKIKEVLTEGKIERVEKIEVAGAGFINFFLETEYFKKTIEQILEEKERYGRNLIWHGKKVMVEYTDPNPFKVFHIGHLMSNAIGESLSRLIEFSGAEVRRANYQGDVGLHVAKTLWGLAELGGDPKDVEALGAAYVEGARAYEESEGAKEKIENINKALYAKDPALAGVYQAGRETSLRHFEEIYKKLGTVFNFYFFESEVAARGMELVKKHRDIFVESDGALVFRGEEVDKTLHTRVFINKMGLPTYEAKEIGLAHEKYERYRFDESISITANEQSDYFRVVLAAIKKIAPELGEKMRHVAHGLLRFASGKMASRKGNVITGESLIADVEKLAREKMETSTHLAEEEQITISTEIAVGAIKYSILKQSIGKDIIFDFEKSLSFEGDSGPYLQYTYARSQSILAKAQEVGLGAKISDLSDGVEIAKRAERFPSEVARALQDYAPQRICTYLIELASAFNAYYAQNKIVDLEQKSVSENRIALTAAVGQVLKNGLWLLGMKAPERM